MIKTHATYGSLTILTSIGKYIVYANRPPTTFGYQLSPIFLHNLDFAINNFVLGKLTNGDLIIKKLCLSLPFSRPGGQSTTPSYKDPSMRELSRIIDRKIEESHIPEDARRSLRLTLLWLEQEKPSAWSSHLNLELEPAAGSDRMIEPLDSNSSFETHLNVQDGISQSRKRVLKSDSSFERKHVEFADRRWSTADSSTAYSFSECSPTPLS